MSLSPMPGEVGQVLCCSSDGSLYWRDRTEEEKILESKGWVYKGLFEDEEEENDRMD